MTDNPFVLIGALIIVAALVALISTPLVARMFDLAEGRTRVFAMLALFAIGLVLAYGGWRVLSSTGLAAVAFHEKQAKQLDHPLLLR